MANQRENSLEDNDNISDDLDDITDLPTALIVTNVDPRVFHDMNERNRFEELFRRFDNDATFQYFKSFKRSRVNLSTPEQASQARIQLDRFKFNDNTINCYFVQPHDDSDVPDSKYLLPPLPQRQFLISPPASPPEGWQPAEEAEPCVNYDILSALANLAPGESHELHPANGNLPSIYVDICGGNEVNEGGDLKPTKIIGQIHTPRPPSVPGPPPA